MGSLNCDFCDLGISRIERGCDLRPTIGSQRSDGTGNELPYYEQSQGRESEFPPTKFCTYF